MNPKNAKYKSETEKDVEFAKGGDDKMFGQQQAEPQTPGHTEQEDKAGPGAKYAEGGKSKMFGYSPSVPQQAGRTGQR
jgi:hypothetical protein